MSGVKKFMHKIKEKMESVGDGHQQDKDSHMQKDTWPGVDQTGTGTTGTTQAGTQGVGKQTTLPSASHPTSIPGHGSEKVTDASRLADGGSSFHPNTMVSGSTLSSGTTPKVMTGEHKSGTGDALGKSPVYSPLGSGAHESVAAAKPDVTDVGTGMGMGSATMAPGGHGTKGQQAFTGTLPNVGGAAQKEPKLHTSDTDPVSSKTGAGAPNPMTHTKDIDYSPNLTTKPPPSSGFSSGTGMGTGTGMGMGSGTGTGFYDSKPGSHIDELKDAKAKAGSGVNRSPDLTGDIGTLGTPAQGSTTHTYDPKSTSHMPGSTLTGSTGNSHMDELKDAKAKAGSAVNKSPNLTGDVHELGKPTQEAEGAPKPLVGGISPPISSSSKDTLPTGGNKDYTSALDKIADNKEAGAAAGAGAGGGLLAAAADYVHHGARSVADTAHGYTHEGDRSLPEDIKATGQSAVDQVRGTAQPYTDAAADKAQAAKDSLTSNQSTTGSKGISGPGSVSGKRVTTPADDNKSYVQQAQEALSAAAAVTADKASQAYQVVADKAYETGIPQKLGEHANTARDTAAAKYNELSDQAQRHGAAARDVGADRLATAKAQAQDYAQTAQQKAAEHLERVRNATPEDVNRSGLGRMAGGIALLWLASYAIGIPFKYGLAGALLAISAVLFAEWDQGNRARRARTSGGTMSGGPMSGGTMDTKGGVADDIPHYGSTGGIDAKSGAAPYSGTTGGIDAKTGGAPSSIHEASISDVSNKAKQNFPVDPMSTNIGGSGSAAHSSHGATSYGGAGLGSDSTAGPTLGASGLGQSEGARASAPAKSSGPSALESSFYRSAEPVHMPQVGGAAAAQTTRGTATGADFDSTYRSTEPAHKREQLQPTATEKARYTTEE